MNVICCQFDITWEDKPANYRKVRELLEATTVPKSSLIVLPEMFSTGFSMNVETIAEESPSTTEAFCQEIARKYQSFVLGGVVTRSADKGLNEAVVFSPGGQQIVRYRKIHPFALGGEAAHYQAGKEIVSFNFNDLTIVPFICYDLRFPEIFRHAVRRGGELFAVIANWPAIRESHWVTLLQARAIENQAYVIGVNRIGQAPGLGYSGRTLIVDPQGNIIADAGDRECTLTVRLERDKLTEWRSSFPALHDMRSEFIR